ncbi:hypothetical protein [Desulfovibrio ferrophilus]|uniref:hypothetical protein n=1 Tax=Desulfovibrio ferrophilus TaxID=241368 RepID=UPI000F843975|nr:hypothetical protein [Desulfovibrio ferrophilus]
MSDTSKAGLPACLWKKPLVFRIPREFTALIAVFAPAPAAFGYWWVSIIVAFVMWTYAAVQSRRDPDWLSLKLTRLRKIGFTRSEYNGNEYLP